MGIALADASAELGAEVILVLGPVNITPQNNAQNSPILTNNPIKYILTLINNATNHINTFMKQITTKLPLNFMK